MSIVEIKAKLFDIEMEIRTLQAEYQKVAIDLQTEVSKQEKENG